MAKDKGKTGISLFTNATADKVLKYAKVTPVSSSGASQAGLNRPTNAPKPNKTLTARVVEEIKTNDVGYGYYKMKQVRRDKGETPDLDVWTDVGIEFTGFELGETTGIEVGKVFTCRYITGTGGAVWSFRQGGGGGERSYVVITSVESASSYTGNVITSPDDATVITEGVTIKVENALSNAFDVGYSNFADKTKDGSGNDVYYLAALLLT